MNNKQLYRRIIAAYRPYLGIFILGVVFTLIVSGVDSIFPYGIKLLIDKGITHPDPVVVRWIPIAVLVLAFGRSFGSVAASYFMNCIAKSVVMDFRRKIFKKCQTLSATFFDKHSTGKVLSTLLYNTDQIVQAGIDVLVNILQDGTVAIGLLIVMCVTSWRLFLMVAVFGPPIMLTAAWASRRMRRYSKRVQQGMGDITHIAEEGIKSYQAVRVYGGQSYETDKFWKVTKKNLDTQLKVNLIGSLSSASMQVFISVPLVIIFFLFRTLLTSISAGTFIAFITAMVMIIKPLRRITRLNSQIQSGLAGAEGVFELIDANDESDAGHHTTARAKGHIEFKQVNFAYPNTETDVLSAINIEIKPGQMVALVGRSGSGKSTIAKLLTRFYQVEQGQILLDGVNINDYVLTNLREQVAIVSQHVTLFNDTIAHNVAYGGQAGASEADIIAALKAANADEFVDQLSEGMHTMVGENGVMLSGGQRQRIAIARAILKKAPILILDEATSALDTETERKIQSALDTLMQSCTSLVIAHRLSTIEKADWIVVMDRGHIIEQGRHAELMAKDSYYAELQQLQQLTGTVE